MEKLAIPVKDPSFNLLESGLFERWEGWESLNLLILSFIIKALTSNTGPYPILVLIGEQGSGKSYFSKYIRSVIDPNMAAVRTCSKKEEDFILSASNSHLIAVDNNSGLQSEQADWFCRLSTGGGFSVRRLYSNDEEHIIYAMNPIIINGINSPTARGDFLERSIVIELPRITNRESEQDMMNRERCIQEKVIGSILTLLAQASHIVKDIKIKDSPRMADFCTWGVALEKVLSLPEGTFLRVYKENQLNLTEAVLDSSPFAQAILDFISNIPGNEWKGNATELLKEFEINDYAPKDFQSRKYWPNSPEHVGKQINRLSPALYQQGVTILRTKREITIKKEGSNDYTNKFDKSTTRSNENENVGGDSYSTI